MKRFFKWLLWAIATVIALTAILLFNPNLVKSPIESYLSDLTGHSVDLSGDLEIDLGRLMVLTVSDVGVFATDMSKGGALLALDHLELSLVTTSLLKDTIVLESLQLDGLQLKLETNANGRGNWQNPAGPPKAAEQKSAGKKLIIDSVRIAGADIHYHNTVKNIDHLLHIGDFSLQPVPSGMLQSTLDGQFNGRKLSFSGNFGPFDNILAGRDIGFDAKGNFGDLAINGAGLIDNLSKPARPE